MRTLEDHLFGPGPKRILSLDGGGVRGLITLGLLRQVESLLRARMPAGQQEQFRLCHYFDLIGGTSTGGLIATLLALGWDVERIVKAYRAMAPKVFGKSRMLLGVKAKFDGAALDAAIHEILGEVLRDARLDPKAVDSLRFDSDLLRTGLALVTKRIDKGSVWTLTNNPKSKYWSPRSELWEAHFKELGRERDFYPNSQYQLAKIVRASASAPFYLDGVGIDISEKEHGHFLDGGVSPFNNPSQELFLMTTLKAYDPSWNAEGVSPFGFRWRTGADQLFILSLGTGDWKADFDVRKFMGMWSAQQATTALLSIINDASLDSTTWLQALSEQPRASTINGNLEQMHGLRVVDEPLLSFRRVSPRLDKEWLTTLGVGKDYGPGVMAKLRQLDNSEEPNLERLLAIGTAAGQRDIVGEDLPPAFNLEEMRRGGPSGQPAARSLQPPSLPVSAQAPAQAQAPAEVRRANTQAAATQQPTGSAAIPVPTPSPRRQGAPALATPPSLPAVLVPAAPVSPAPVAPVPQAAPSDKIAIGFVGHRWNRLPAGEIVRIKAEIEEALAIVEKEARPDELVLLSGLAEGSDRLAAVAAGRRGWSLGAILPFSKERYRKDFEADASKQEFETLLAQCVVVDPTPAADGYLDANDGYREQSSKLISAVSALIAIWDGEDAHGTGGTAETIAAAKAKGLPVLWISTVTAGLRQV